MPIRCGSRSTRYAREAVVQANSGAVMALFGRWNCSLIRRSPCWPIAAAADRTDCKAVKTEPRDEQKSCATMAHVNPFRARPVFTSKKASASGLNHQAAAAGGRLEQENLPWRAKCAKKALAERVLILAV